VTSKWVLRTSSEFVPTNTVKLPGSTTRRIRRSYSVSASGPILNVTVRVSPGCSVIRLNDLRLSQVPLTRHIVADVELDDFVSRAIAAIPHVDRYDQ